jgi:hypothetical protein
MPDKIASQRYLPCPDSAATTYLRTAGPHRVLFSTPLAYPPRSAAEMK